MTYTEIAPHPTLSSYIDAYWTACGNSAKPGVEKILPDGCVDIIFNLGDDCRTDDATVLMKSERTYLVGTMTRLKQTEMDIDTKLFGVRFKPGAFTAFYKVAPLSEITDHTIEFENSFSFNFKKLVKSREEYLNQVFIESLDKPDHYLLAQLQTIIKYRGQIKIEELASKHFTTVRQLERSFKQHLGISPKEFANLVRYQNTLKAIENRKPGESLLSIAFDLGYYDHAHLTKDFKKYQGFVPASL